MATGTYVVVAFFPNHSHVFSFLANLSVSKFVWRVPVSVLIGKNYILFKNEQNKIQLHESEKGK